MDNSIKILESFSDRQVVLNTYLEDELLDKTGIFLDNIETNVDNVNFIRNKEVIYTIDRNKYPNFKYLEGFNNYYEFSNDRERLEVYFPHK